MSSFDHDLAIVTQELAAETNQFRQARLEKLKALLETGIQPFPSQFKRSHVIAEVVDTYSHLQNDESTTDDVIVAGRIRSNRNKFCSEMVRMNC